jgi:hypothetical protein
MSWDHQQDVDFINKNAPSADRRSLLQTSSKPVVSKDIPRRGKPPKGLRYVLSRLARYLQQSAEIVSGSQRSVRQPLRQNAVPSDYRRIYPRCGGEALRRCGWRKRQRLS